MRDVLLTLLAWMLLLYFLRDLVWMVAYWGLAALHVSVAPRWQSGEMWRDTLPFLKVVGMLVLWLVVFSIVRWRLLTNRLRSASEPAPLDAVDQATAFGVPITLVDALRAAPLATVNTADAGVVSPARPPHRGAAR
ncbi:hypothetical protein [Stenotrophomonas sp. PD6]|uniref:hypothetical protein n=1 Tax=Stenotrophomonas sp. PD6 TaxID=3368612 RepID=UPI003BA18080